MLQSDRYQQTLHTPPSSPSGAATLVPESENGLSHSDRLVAALRLQIEIDNEEPERWDGLA